MKMLNKRKTSNVLILINLALALFIIVRAGSADIEPIGRLASPLAITVLDQPAPVFSDTLILNDFEKINDMMNMYDQGGEYTLDLSGDHHTHGNSALLIDKELESNIELATVHFPRQWKGYVALELDVYNDSDNGGTVWIRVGSQYDARRFYDRSQKFAKAYPLTPGENTISIPIHDIAEAFGKLPLRKSLHFNFPAGEGKQIYLDFMRLVRHDGTGK